MDDIRFLNRTKQYTEKQTKEEIVSAKVALQLEFIYKFLYGLADCNAAQTDRRPPKID